MSEIIDRSKPRSSKLNLTRRSFIFGGSACLAAFGAATLPACNRKKNSNPENDKGDIVASVAYQSQNISPVGNTTALGRSTFWHISEGLYNIDYTTLKTYNALAALSPNKINDYTYEVVLRDDAVFSNGNPVTPQDVVNSFKLNMVDEIFAPLLSFIKDVAAKDSKTITFTLNYPFENLIEQRLALVYIWPATQRKEEYTVNPIGSGPWVLKSFDGKDGGTIEFERNPNYSGKYDVPGEKMTWHINLDNDTRINSIANNNSLVVEAVPELDVEKLNSAGAKVEFVQGFGCAYFMFNTLKAPFNDKRVRQAFHYAINKQKLIDSKLDGHAAASSSLLPTSHPNYNKANSVYDFSEEKAKTLLREAGITNLNCALTVDSNWVSSLASQIVGDLKNVGINAQLDVKTINWADYADSKKVLPFDVILAPGDPSQLGNDTDLILSFWYGDNV